TLEPLQPKYVSTVDSGNLIASLWVLAQGCQDMENQPQLENLALLGLADTLSVVMNRYPPDHTTAIPLDTLRGLFQGEASGIEVTERIRLAAEPVRKLIESLRWSTSLTEERAYWFTRLEAQIQAWIGYFDRYLRWADVMAAPPDEFLRPLGETFIRERRRLLLQLPSWGELADGKANQLLNIGTDGRTEEGLPPQLDAWIADLRV